ncbi:MAG: OmpA family protein [Micrococcaceae bacterium]
MRPDMKKKALSFGGASTLGLSLLLAGPAAADESLQPPELEFEITEKVLADSITQFSDSITQFSIEDSIESLGEAESSEEDVIVLQADILFVAMKADLPDSATSRIEKLVEEIPDGASVQVHGHTDSNPMPEDHEYDNQSLSEARAQAVADALSSVRSDLELDVEGFGDTDPAVSENPDDPSTYAANRRVEIRYN